LREKMTCYIADMCPWPIILKVHLSEDLLRPLVPEVRWNGHTTVR
jgi:polyferredoxin